MTHNDIYTKFLIEYDKANVTSSYPALTKYEAATLLDRAYLALIARKVTGNNPRRASLEYDIKAIEDLRPLLVTKALSPTTAVGTADNEFVYKLPKKTEMLYFIDGLVDYSNATNAADGMKHKTEVVNVADHRTAQKFMATNSNMPWIKQPIVFLEGDNLHLLIDTYKHKKDSLSFYATYIKQFAKFATGSAQQQTTPTQEEPTPTPTPSTPTVDPDPIVNPEPTQEEPTVEPTPTPVIPEPIDEEPIQEVQKDKYSGDNTNQKLAERFIVMYTLVGNSYDITWFSQLHDPTKWPTDTKLYLHIINSDGTHDYVSIGSNIKSGTYHTNFEKYPDWKSFNIIAVSNGKKLCTTNTCSKGKTTSYKIVIEGAPSDVNYVLGEELVIKTESGIYVHMPYSPVFKIQSGQTRTISLYIPSDGEVLSVKHILDKYPNAKLKWDNGSSSTSKTIKPSDFLNTYTLTVNVGTGIKEEASLPTGK